MLIQYLIIFYNGLFSDSFFLEATLLKDSAGCFVMTEGAGKNAIELELVKPIVGDQLQGLSSDAFAPKRFTDPVANFRG